MDLKSRGRCGIFDVDAGQGEPCAVVASGEELELSAKPFAIDGSSIGSGDAEKFWRAGYDDHWIE
jgi:hypothetical protein